MSTPRVLLIGGSSHLGKSTLAAHLAERLGGAARSTDRLARHPGRPWAAPGAEVPPHVAEHYATLSEAALMASVLAHYRRLAPDIAALVHGHPAAEPPLVLEGSALLPGTAAPLLGPDVRGIWLLAAPGLIGARIRAESRAAEADTPARRLIEAFLARSLAFDAFLREEVRRLRLPALEVDAAASPEALADAVLAA